VREPFWSVSDAAERLGVSESMLRDRIGRCDLVAQWPLGGGPMIRDSELQCREATPRSATAEPDAADQVGERPAVALVMVDKEREPHALAPGVEGAAALRGVEPGAAGWHLIGHTIRPLYLIVCDACWARTAALLTRQRAKRAA
jgi:hypothetical protein